jgi:hypothetical protein
VLFDGASNVQNARKLVSITYPCITVVHGADHVVHCSSRTYSQKCQCSNVYPRFQNGADIFGSPHSVLMPSSRSTPSCTKNCIYIGFIKISECLMAGDLIGLLRFLRLRDILRATIASKEFKDIWATHFWREVIVLENNEFWKYLFTLCCSLYAPMRIL